MADFTGGAASLGSRAIIGRLATALEETAPPAWVDALGMRVMSNQSSEEYEWLGMTAPLREWIGGRNAKGFRANGITIQNLRFESTLEVLVEEIRRDKTDQIQLRISELAVRASQHWTKLLTDLIVTPGNAYDGTPFFGTTHDEGDSGTQINALTPAMEGSEPTAAEMESAVIAAIQAALGYVDDQGEPMNTEARNFVCMVPPALFSVAAAALTDSVIVDGSASRTNTLVNLAGYNVSFVVNPRLTASDVTFYLFRTDSPSKSFILQEETAPQITALAEGSDLEFQSVMHQYGVKVSRNVGTAYWQYAIKNVLT